MQTANHMLNNHKKNNVMERTKCRIYAEDLNKVVNEIKECRNQGFDIIFESTRELKTEKGYIIEISVPWPEDLFYLGIQIELNKR